MISFTLVHIPIILCAAAHHFNGRYASIGMVCMGHALATSKLIIIIRRAGNYFNRNLNGTHRKYTLNCSLRYGPTNL